MSVCSVLSRYWRCRIGATAIEYALIAGLLAVVLVPGLLWLRDLQQQVSQKLASQLDPAAAAAIMATARSDFREPPRDARDHQGP